MTNYEVYFGTKERAVDSLALFLEFHDYPRKEVKEFEKEAKDTRIIKWLESECTNQRWWKNQSITRNR